MPERTAQGDIPWLPGSRTSCEHRWRLLSHLHPRSPDLTTQRRSTQQENRLGGEPRSAARCRPPPVSSSKGMPTKEAHRPSPGMTRRPSRMPENMVHPPDCCVLSSFVSSAERSNAPGRNQYITPNHLKLLAVSSPRGVNCYTDLFPKKASSFLRFTSRDSTESITK
jgi:hypothetical protein